MRLRPITFLFTSALAAGLLSSCSTPTCELNLSEHPELPSARLTHVMRHVLEKSDYLSTRAFWGNYGGPGCSGGEPIDAMDEYFRQHDLAYLQGVELEQLVEADRILIAQLESLDPSTLTAEADDYRRGAIRYFSRPISRVVGKPPDVLFGYKRNPVVVDTSSLEEAAETAK